MSVMGLNPGVIDTTTDASQQLWLNILSTITAQTNARELLGRLSRIVLEALKLDDILFLKIEDSEKPAQLLTMDLEPALPEAVADAHVDLSGTEIRFVLEQIKPVFIPDLHKEMLAISQLASQAQLGAGRCGWVFPVAAFSARLGALLFVSAQKRAFNTAEKELMLFVSSLVAMALKAEKATAVAEESQRQLEKERDRLGLLLDINNQIIAKRDVNELFRSASQTIRKYFENDFAGFWLKDGGSAQFECHFLDFPMRQSPSDEVPDMKLSGSSLQRMSDRVPLLSAEKEIEAFPSSISGILEAESIKSLVSAPLVTAQGAVGFLALGSRHAHYFKQTDVDLLAQVGNQIALALDSAIAYGHLDAFKNRLQDEKSYLESEIRSELSFDDIVGKSPALTKVLEQVAVVASTRSTVLLHGETGCGKELIARAIHNASPRRERTFVKLNCAAIPAALVESELFGHEKGAFTGAIAQKKGRFEVADGGTLFLDEIGDITLELQPKLLRALQEQEFERVGGTATIRVDVRLIAATHQDLRAMIHDKLFREDLFYRLNVFPIEIPPLRERREDIPLLVHYFVARHAREMRKTIRRIPPEAMTALIDAPWPGNVRELENFLERAVILTQGTELAVPIHDLAKSDSMNDSPSQSSASTLRESERKAILEALRLSNGKVSGPAGAAERLGMKRSTLRNMMARLNITKVDS